jgi:hypothetical protein
MTRTAHRFGSLFALLALLLATAPVRAAEELRAWLDRDTLQLGETVTLNVEAASTNAGQPDFSALKQDFNLLGTQSSQQISIVNGARSAKTLWAVGLEPRHAGSITIAPIAVGAASTAALVLRVLDVPAGAPPQAGGDVFLEVSAEPLDPYVQQQVRYTAKLYFAFELTNGNLGEPQADGVAVKQLGQDKPYISTIGTRRYHVVERHYALTPEHSGTIDIPALTFRGSALDATDPTGFFSRGRQVNARSQALRLEVKPKPAAWTDGAWLPAASLLLKDEGELPTEVHVGDPVTRTIRLQAQGLAFEQLPELTLATPDGAEIYPDKADTRTRDDGEWLYGERVRKFAFVPNRAGTLTIPGLRVHWWDTANDREQVTELPSRTIEVLPALGTAATSTPIPSVDPAAPPAAAQPQPADVSSDSRSASASPGIWQMLAAIAFVLWLATLALWWRSRRRPPRAMPASTKRAGDTSKPRAEFLRACALGDLAGAERALVAWARSERPEVRNLGELTRRIDPGAQRDALSALQRARYAGESVQGTAVQLERAFKPGLAWTPVEHHALESSPLPELYPHR